MIAKTSLGTTSIDFEISFLSYFANILSMVWANKMSPEELLKILSLNHKT